MKQEIVPFIESHPVISGILFLVFCASTGWVTGIYIFGPCLIWANKLRRKPKPGDMTDHQKEKLKWHIDQMEELKKKEDEAKKSLLTISNEELADKLRDPSILSVELINAARNEAIARMIDSKEAKSFPRNYVLTKEDENPYGNLFRDALAELNLAECALEKAMDEAGVNPKRPSEMTATGILNSEREKERAAAHAFCNERLDRAEARAATQAQMPSSPITASEEAEKTGEAYKSNVATGIRSLPKIDLYNLPVFSIGNEPIHVLANRIISKWNNSPKEKRPAVLRVRMDKVEGQVLGDLLKAYGIPVEPKRKP